MIHAATWENTAHCPNVPLPDGTVSLVHLALLLVVASFAFWLYVLFDTIGSDAGSVRLFPKPVWVFVVLLLPKVGAMLWFLLGRPSREALTASVPSGRQSTFPDHDHSHRARATPGEEEEDFLRRCRERAEEQRRRAREIQAQEEREHRGQEPRDERSNPDEPSG